MIDYPGDDRIDVRGGFDTDHDGLPDTVVLPDPVALILAADTDRDGLADLLVRFGPDGRATTIDLAVDPAPWWSADPACYDPSGTGLALT